MARRLKKIGWKHLLQNVKLERAAKAIEQEHLERKRKIDSFFEQLKTQAQQEKQTSKDDDKKL